MADQTLYQLLSEAGWTMIPLYGCSLLAVTVAIRKVVQFASARIDDRGALDVARAAGPFDVHQSDGIAALGVQLAQDPSPLGQVMARTAEALATAPLRAEATAERAANATLDELESGMTLLAFVAQVAPLFGLLGTVLGMVDLFSGMEAAGAAVETTTLSSGIWKALLTTAAGLIVAIPTLGAHAWFSRRIERLRLALEEGAGRLLDGALGTAATP